MRKKNAAKGRRNGLIRDIETLKARLVDARIAGLPAAAADRVKRLVLVFVDAALARGADLPGLLRDISIGLPAVQIGSAEIDAQARDRTGPLATAACRSGCAFCCILSGEDGGTITEFEARALHAALAPLKGQPDGRAWHSKACPALDPETRLCRAYDARPMICRTYHSPDAAACESVAHGIPADGPGVLGGQVTYLAANTLARAALTGSIRVPAYSLATLAAASVEGAPEDTALSRARARPGAMEKELKRASRGLHSTVS